MVCKEFHKIMNKSRVTTLTEERCGTVETVSVMYVTTLK